MHFEYSILTESLMTEVICDEIKLFMDGKNILYNINTKAFITKKNDLSLQVPSELTEIFLHLDKAITILAPILAFWLGKGKLFAIKHKNKVIKLRGYNANDIVKILVKLGEDDK